MNLEKIIEEIEKKWIMYSSRYAEKYWTEAFEKMKKKLEFEFWLIEWEDYEVFKLWDLEIIDELKKIFPEVLELYQEKEIQRLEKKIKKFENKIWVVKDTRFLLENIERLKVEVEWIKSWKWYELTDVFAKNLLGLKHIDLTSRYSRFIFWFYDNRDKERVINFYNWEARILNSVALYFSIFEFFNYWDAQFCYETQLENIQRRWKQSFFVKRHIFKYEF